MKNIVKILLASALGFAGFLMVASAQNATSTIPKITFPIAELGSCASQVECRAYCNKPENMEACTAFAETHRLISQQQGEQNRKFTSAIKNGGPGGCKTADACKTYCEAAEHATECAEFAERYELATRENIEKAKRYGQMFRDGSGPGGCKSLGECKTFCSKAENLKICADWAREQKLVSPEDSQRLEKFNSLVASGQTPGGCSSKEACEAYCKDASHKQECVDFGVKMGFITGEQGEKIKQTRTGPGGCSSKEACEAYCNQEEHRQECLEFAEEHGLVKKGEGEELRAAINNVRVGIANAPQEVKDCLNAIDPEIITKMEAGAFTPTSELSRKIAECFKKFRTKVKDGLSQKINNSPEAAQCIKNLLGEEGFANLKASGQPANEQTAAKIKNCLELMPARPATTTPAQAPATLRQCVVRLLGNEDIESLDGANVTPEVKAAVEKCRAQMGLGQKPATVPPVEGDRLRKCLMEKLGTDDLEEFASGGEEARLKFKQAMVACAPQAVPQTGTVPPPPKQGIMPTQPIPTKPPITDSGEVRGASTELHWWQKALLFFAGD